jgi:Helix-turn-helix domain
MEKKKATEAAQNTNLNRNNTSAAWQRARVIQALRLAPTDTVQFRERWGVMSPAPRVLELRMRGYDIRTMPVTAITADGVVHRGVARYVLVSEPTPGSGNGSAMPAPANDAVMTNDDGDAP